ncbi:MAG: hypothetical protein JWQ23_3085 [Herminiimonas sp.]|nr:hypothetical protein [Herminiimonas sp.]
MLDTLIENMHLEDDRALACRLKLAPRTILMMREGRISVSPSMLIWILEASRMTMQELRELLKDNNPNYYLTCK